MITEEEKARIRTEELYRHEVRKQFEAQDSSKSELRVARVLRFFNSNLGIWLLSSVVLAALSWEYTRWENRRTERSHTTSKILQLDAEIVARLDNPRGSFDITNLSRMEFDERMSRLLDCSTRGLDSGGFPEYSQHSLRSLLFELHRVVGADERKSIAAAIRTVDELRLLESSLKSSLGGQSVRPDMKVTSEDLQKAKSLRSRLMLSRWSLLDTGDSHL